MKPHSKSNSRQFAVILGGAIITALAATALLSGWSDKATHSTITSPTVGDQILATETQSDGVALVQFASRPYHIDRIYESMQGPSSIQNAIDLPRLAERQGAPITWIRGIKTEVVDDGSLSPVNQELFCHSNLELQLGATSVVAREKILGVAAGQMDSRLFTLVPGRLSLRLPDGFALPMFEGERVMYQSMVLNLNDPEIDETVRIRTQVEVLPASTGQTIRPLYRRALYALQEVNPELSVAVTAEEAEQCGCGPGQSLTASNAAILPQFGGDKTLHWYVPQGQHTYTQDITQQLSLPFDTTIHYATVHLHPRGKWVELRDLTTGETVLKLKATDFADKRGIEQVEEFSSQEGIELFADHEYEMVTRYENDTEAYLDAMSILYLYLAGKS